jgi:hypothetical protein
MVAKYPKLITYGLATLTLIVIALIVAVVIVLFQKKGDAGPPKSAAQLGHTLMPVTVAAVRTCLTDQGIDVSKRSATQLTAAEPGAKPVRLTFAKNFDAATATAVPGRALNNVTLSIDVSDLTQLEVYAFDHCIVQPGEQGGKGPTGALKRAPVESVTS